MPCESTTDGSDVESKPARSELYAVPLVAYGVAIWRRLMTFTAADVRPGDVLLFRGNGFISWAIRTFDGTEVNHAAVAIAGGELAEAGALGLQRRAVPTAFGSGEFMKVHRLPAGADLAPVVTKAGSYLANSHFYAYQQIVLLGFLTLTRRIPLPRLARRLVRSALDHAASAVTDLLPAGKSWMICSEFVYRAYEEAAEGDPDPFALAIGGVSFGDASGAEPTLLDWGLANARDVPVVTDVSFSAPPPPPPPQDPVHHVAAIEADLAPLVAHYAEGLLAAGEIGPEDLPPLVDVSFGPQRPLPPEPTDDELLASMARFGNAVIEKSGGTPPLSDPTFGPVTAAITAAAVKGALEGVKRITVDPNFVTPGDLLKSPSLTEVGRIG